MCTYFLNEKLITFNKINIPNILYFFIIIFYVHRNGTETVPRQVTHDVSTLKSVCLRVKTTLRLYL
jgi:hypothetical protein